MLVNAVWPEIPYKAWQETCSALHLYAEIVGKYRLARTPWVNHSWHATFYVNARGLTTSLVPDASGIEITFDLSRHIVIGEASDGRRVEMALGPMSVADFHARICELVGRLGGTPEFDGRPNEVPDPIPFATVRMVLQLVLVGYALTFLFAAVSPLWTALAAFIMVLFASREIVARQKRRLPGIWSYGLGAGCTLLAAGTITTFALLTELRPDPWY